MANGETIISQFRTDPITGEKIKQRLEITTKVNPLSPIISLEEIPDKASEVRIQNALGEYLIRVWNMSDIISAQYFYVNAEQQKVHVHSSMMGQSVTTTFDGIGGQKISSQNIFTKVDEDGNILELLSEVIDGGKDAIEAISTLGSAVDVINELDATIVQANSDKTTIINSIDTKITEGEGIVTNIETAITNGDISTVKSDIVTINSSLSDKANQLDVRLKTVKLNATSDFDDETKTQMTGITPITYSPIPADGSILPVKTAFLLLANLFDKSAITSGFYVYPTTGILTSSGLYGASDYMPIVQNTSYTMNNNNFYAWFNSAKVFISGGGVVDSSAITTITAPVNACFIRISPKLTQINGLQFVIGSSLSREYMPYVYKLSDDFLSSKILKSDVLIKGRNIEGFQVGKNLFNKEDVTSGAYMWSDGLLVVDANFYYSGYIPILPSTQYCKGGTYSFAYYDSNKVYISGGAGKALTTPSNAKYVIISTTKNLIGTTSGINEEQLELGTVQTLYEQYYFKVKNQVSNNVLNNNLPSKIYGLVGKELNIYFDNILSDKDTKYDFDVVCSVGSHFENYYRLTPTVAGNYPITIIVYKDDIEVTRIVSTIVVSATSVGNAVTKKLLVIGDSTTDNTFLIPHLNDNFNTDVMDIVTIGTRGTEPNKHEGHAGWAMSTFFTTGSPFWVGGVFDFSSYMTTNSFSGLNYAVINMGINDMFGASDDITATTSIVSVLAKYTTMINSIKAYDTNIKVGIALTIPPNYSQDSFGKSYQCSQTRKRYKKSNFDFVAKLIATFGNREGEGIYLIPINVNLDTRYNFGIGDVQVNARNTMTVKFPIDNPTMPSVHPAESGYWQIADSYWYFLKSF